MRPLIVGILLVASAQLYAQDTSKSGIDSLTFNDTIDVLAFQSKVIDLGARDSLPHKLTRYFIYLSDTPTIITKPLTSDPHFICDYPKEALEKGKVYEFTICFANRGYPGPINKRLGSKLENGEPIYFDLTAWINPPWGW